MNRKFWLSLKKERIKADMYYKGTKIMTLSVNKDSPTLKSIIDVEANDDITFKIIKNNQSQLITDEFFFNKEEYNK